MRKFRCLAKNESNFFGFQKYAAALKKLRNAYFSNATNIEAIKRANADLLSDSMLNYDTIKSIEFQAKANQRAISENGRKNTFFFR